MKELKDKISKDFYRVDGDGVECHTVGEVIEKLKLLPEDLPVEQGIYGGVALKVFNISRSNPCLSFEEL